ncbi:hypothetical protein GCM10010140_10280 [Streptosporangium pseudovulgare]|uniref:Uncharacterized protein n=1 Tax=Streptosporangium pseudovulgare TaxID=35765 RepID=A0ABQ2QJ23_9ACTN|nr:hypothetical protein GCM10010140_10280 [Streptosporangium pseudovulgare]
MSAPNRSEKFRCRNRLGVVTEACLRSFHWKSMPLFPNSTGRRMSDLAVITAAVAGTETTTAAVAAVVTVFRCGAGGTAGGEDGAPSVVRTPGPARSRREA